LNKPDISKIAFHQQYNTAAFKRGARNDNFFKALTFVAAVVVLLSVLGIFVFLVSESIPAFREFGFFGFLTSVEWNPVTHRYGAAIAVFGTIVTSIIALLIAVPVSFGIALYITQLAPGWLKRPVGTAIELLAAIPSIIYGMWGLFFFVPWFSSHVQPWIIDHIGSLPIIGALFEGAPLGIGVFTASLILAIMVIPFIASIMRDVFDIVPPVLKESAYGLGATTWEVVWHVILPYTKSGVIGGIMLGLGRALGETMAVTFVIGNAQILHTSLFQPGSTISSVLANEYIESDNVLHTSSLIALALILYVITFIVLTASRLLLMKMSDSEGKQS